MSVLIQSSYWLFLRYGWFANSDYSLKLVYEQQKLGYTSSFEENKILVIYDEI